MYCDIVNHYCVKLCKIGTTSIINVDHSETGRIQFIHMCLNHDINVSRSTCISLTKLLNCQIKIGI